MKLRQVVGAHQGLNFWVGQLLSAVILLLCIVWLSIVFATLQPAGHAGLVSFITSNVVRVPATLGMLALCWHAYLGAKSILMDYLPWTVLRIWKYIATMCYLALCLVWLIGIMWGTQ